MARKTQRYRNPGEGCRAIVTISGNYIGVELGPDITLKHPEPDFVVAAAEREWPIGIGKTEDQARRELVSALREYFEALAEGKQLIPELRSRGYRLVESKAA